MTLETAWRRQLAFTSLVLGTLDKPIEQLTEDDRVRLTKEYLLSMHSELTEVLNNVPWKKHRFIGPADRDALLEELVDVQKFLWGLMSTWQVTPTEFLRAFDRKSDLVEQRFNQDNLLPQQVASTKVAIVDIDGVVADWENGFDDWVKQTQEYEPDDYAKHVDPGLRQRLKDQIHASGGMQKLPLLPESHVAISRLQNEGYTVVWLSARPIARHPRLMADTVAWLKNHALPTDYIYWSNLNKHVFVVDKFPMAAVLFDDAAEIVTHAKEFGINAYQVIDGQFYEQVEQFLKDIDETHT